MIEDTWVLDEHKGIAKILNTIALENNNQFIFRDTLWRINLVSGWVDPVRQKQGLTIRIQKGNRLREYTLQQI